MRSKFNLSKLGRDHTDPDPLPDILQNALYNDDYILSQAETQVLEGIHTSLKTWMDLFAITRAEYDARNGTMELTAENLWFTLNGQSMAVSKDGRVKSDFKIGGSETDRRFLKMRMTAEIYEQIIKERMENIRNLIDIVVHVHSSKGAWRVVNASIEHAQNLDEISRGALIYDDFMGLLDRDKD